MRIADGDGHLWPHTGQQCPECRMPADPALNGQPHPGCLPAETLDDAAFTALVQRVADQIGRRCTDCGQPLPAHAAPGVLVHMQCWQHRAAMRPAGNDGGNAVMGTALQGRLIASYDQLVRVFGQPGDPIDEDKSHVEWVVQTPHGVATIYDYGDCHECETGCHRDPRLSPSAPLTGTSAGITTRPPAGCAASSPTAPPRPDPNEPIPR